MDSVLKFLSKIISFETISTDSSKLKEFDKIISFLKDFLNKEGFKIEIIGKTKPLFLASKFISNKAKTIAVYSHYDVQPIDPINEWSTNPFKLTIKNKKIYGRGTADDKGHLTQNIFSVLELLKEGKLKNNIIFIFEGEEEIGSLNFSKYINQAKKILNSSDFFLLTDVDMVRKNTPTIYYGLRGIIYFELKIFTGKRELHSGVYGNLVYNPIQIIIDIFSKVRILNGKIKIKSFYQDLRRISKKEKEMLFEINKNLKEIKKEAQVFVLNPLDSKYPNISSKIYPSLEINGIYSGYIQEGAKTIIPNYALVKFSLRLVENQDPKKVIFQIKNFIKNNIPKGVKYNLKVLSSAKPFYTDLNNYYLLKVSQLLEKVFNKKCVFNREGGSIPAAEILSKKFKRPIILTGFILPEANIHSPNENYDIDMFFKGIKALKEIYSYNF